MIVAKSLFGVRGVGGGLVGREMEVATPLCVLRGGGRGATDQLAYTDADTVRQIIIIRGEFWREKSVCMSVSTITKQQLAISCYIWRSFCAHFLPPAK